eukprot:6369845-Lingulodinium_polyedra.AAC.1
MAAFWDLDLKQLQLLLKLRELPKPEDPSLYSLVKALVVDIVKPKNDQELDTILAQRGKVPDHVAHMEQ